VVREVISKLPFFLKKFNFNLLKLSGDFMFPRSNIQNVCVISTEFICVLVFISE